MSIFVIVTANATNVSATLTSSTDLAVLKEAPNGLPLSQYMSNSTPTPVSGSPFKTNSAQIVDHSGDNSTDGNIISLANGKNTYGSLWSTKKTFDITKPQTISAWMYFGSGNGEDDINSEGITFVLQNDARGNGALGAGLDGIGAYGFDKSTSSVFNTYSEKVSFMQNSAIQNSVALEFDTAKNNMYNSKNAPINMSSSGIPLVGTTFSQNAYDTQLGTTPPSSLGIPGTLTYGSASRYGNIAVIYPAFAGTYYQTSIDSNINSNYPGFDKATVMVHVDSQLADLTDYTDSSNNPVYWHHVTIDWTPAPSGSNIAKLSYAFNDITKEGLEKTPTTKTIDIDTTKLNATDNLVRWGFTGANGTSNLVATKLVAFDSIPESPTSDVSASITDKTLNKTIIDSSTDKTVSNGDDLSLNYNLNYIRGKESWKSIASKIKIPDNVTLKPDANENIATIDYGDGQSPTKISKDDIVGGNLQYTLAKELDTNNSSAKISISVTAVNEISSDINVKQAPASFTGTNSIAMTSSPAFTILAKKDYSLVLGTDKTEYDLLYKNENAGLSSNLNLGYSSNAPSDLKGSDIVFNLSIGDHNYTAAQDLSLQTGQTTSSTMDIKQLIEGAGDNFWDVFPVNSTQQVKVTAIDRTNGLVSNAVTYNVNVLPDKSLTLNVSDSLAFQNIHYGNQSTYLKRTSDFNLSVTSLREPWQLSVTSKGLYNSDNSLNKNMNLVYKKDNDSDYMNVSETPVIVATNNQSYTTSTTDNISGNWTSDTGLLLKQLGLSPVGHYTGTLTWTTSDVIGNN
ncbi:hypothetical protein FC72_GL002046 [Companilactobacillus tucceti DSM 20183]|uniref:WxL domain-containing protein n=1 Tax=Companilactobacillus tucceti DSM 20183 TaxID=1423811 RepID=A0A0R1IZI2_9LACO|nr:hypothetical protein [Companilactobacillus tucceti]KRK64638.1 hypothetical protein FC72_GL002046 [Companilactobacillus tucceti DSM 20183]